MREHKLSPQMWAILTMLLLVGCGPAATPTFVPPTATATSVAEFDVSFDGTECIVSGLSESPAGRHSFIFNDLSDREVVLSVGRLDEGKTIQDLYDVQGEPGADFPGVSWVTRARKIAKEWTNANGREVWTYLLDEEGEYVIVIYAGSRPINLWLCAQTLAIEAPSE